MLGWAASDVCLGNPMTPSSICLAQLLVRLATFTDKCMDESGSRTNWIKCPLGMGYWRDIETIVMGYCIYIYIYDQLNPIWICLKLRYIMSCQNFNLSRNNLITGLSRSWDIVSSMTIQSIFILISWNNDFVWFPHWIIIIIWSNYILNIVIYSHI